MSREEARFRSRRTEQCDHGVRGRCKTQPSYNMHVLMHKAVCLTTYDQVEVSKKEDLPSGDQARGMTGPVSWNVSLCI